MSGKIAIFFLVAVCLVQGYQSQVAEPRGPIQDAINTIKQIIKQVQDAISEIINNLPEIIKKLEEKIKEIISKINIDEIIQSIKDKIKAAIDHILEHAGLDPEVVKKCLHAEEDAVKQLVEETHAGVAACKQTAKDELADLTAELEKLKNQAHKLVQDSASSVKQCVDEHGTNIPAVVQCLKQHSEELKADAEALVQQIKTTIAVGKDKLATVPVALAKCVHQVAVDTAQKEKAIITHFKACVEAANPEE